MQEAVPGQAAGADVDLQGLVDQLRLGQSRVPLGPPGDEVGLGRARLQVLVVRHLLGDGGVGLGRGARRLGRVVVAGVDFEVRREGEEFGGCLEAVGWRLLVEGREESVEWE